MSRVLFFLSAAVAVVLTVGSAQAQLTHRYNFDTDLSDSVGSADGTQMGDVILAGGQALLNETDVARDGRIDLLANGANGININTYSATTIEFWATPECDPAQAGCTVAGANANDGFSTAVSFGTVYRQHASTW